MKRFASVLLVAVSMVLATTGPVSAAAPAPPSSSSVSIPVLAYHVVSDNPSGRYQLSTAKFTEQMAYLASNGYTTLTADEYRSIMTFQAPAPSKPVLLTFDDGTSDFLVHVVPVLERYGFKAVQFAVSDWVGTPGHLTAAQLAGLPATVEVENHTKDHNDLSTLSYEGAYASVTAADTVLAGIKGSRTEYLAYPYGRYDADAQRALRDAGIQLAFTVAAGKTTPGDDLLALNRNMIVSSETMSSFIKKV
ncbi:polysaccharide deacetylase family protein [Cellulomonas aerilata]|uniref:Xylanase deacetylase n=1 Tax=Cellulomonas aerilata TaxID=515326 RepID=A0A512D8G3_9CELL|nr:polysaccharide deacetylase family protein [Cellulomonas aerilata]GEO32685.1 xylanase deacetylase [Cellulomonas aerilata]